MMKNRLQLGIIASTVGLMCAFILIAFSLYLNSATTVHGSDQYMKGHVIDIQDNIMVIELDSMDEPYPEYYTPVEIRVVDLVSPDPVVTPTAGCQNPDTNENC